MIDTDTIYERLAEQGITTTESDVAEWFETVDSGEIKREIADSFDVRRVAADDSVPGGETLAEFVERKDADPSEYSRGYVLETDSRRFIQFHAPFEGGRQPLTAANIDRWIDEHIDRLAKQSVGGVVMELARDHFDREVFDVTVPDTLPNDGETKATIEIANTSDDELTVRYAVADLTETRSVVGGETITEDVTTTQDAGTTIDVSVDPETSEEHTAEIEVVDG